MRREVAAPEAPLPPLADQAQALAWLDHEYANLRAAIHVAAAGSWTAHAIQLPLQPYFVKRAVGSRIGSLPYAFRRALETFRALGDIDREASTQKNLSVDLHLLERHDDALDHAHQALRIEQRLGGGGEASLRTNLGLMYARLDRHAEAIQHTKKALALHRQAASGRGEAYGLAGDHPAALRRHRKALAVATDIGDADEQSRANDGITRASEAASQDGRSKGS